MSDAAQLGDLLTQADRQLRTAALRDDFAPGPKRAASEIWQASDLARALARYLDDMLTGDQVEVVVNWDASSRSQAAVQVRYALLMAETSLRAAATVTYPATARASEQRRPRGGLAEVVTCVSAGRDLLRTHFTTDSAGIRTPASRWAQVIASEPFAGALLAYIGRQARHLAAWSARTCYVTADQGTLSDQARLELSSAQQWLTLASTAMQACLGQYPVSKADSAVLAAVPANFMPDPRPLAGIESLPVLCEAAMAVSERLRLISRWRPDLAVRSPLMTAESWKWTATATAVASDMSEVLLTALADRAGVVSWWPAAGQQVLTDAAQAAATACARWRQAATAWKYMTTETRGLIAPGLADTGDLVIRLGRLAFADPQWTPARSRRALACRPGDIAPDPGQAEMVLTAVHHVADALAIASAAEVRAVEQVVAANRLYVPTRTLPEAEYGWPRPFGLALSKDKHALCDAYAAAAEASAQLVSSLDVVAAVTGSPSTELAVARAASRVPLGAGQEIVTAAARAGWAVSKARRAHTVEDAVRRAGTTEPLMLLRAKMLDEAGRHLVTEATAELGPADAPVGVEGGRGYSGSVGAVVALKPDATRTAALSFPKASVHGQPPARRPARRAAAGEQARPHRRA